MNALLVLFAAWGLSQDGARQDPPSALSDVVVEGERGVDRAREFVAEVMAPPRGQGPARWDGQVCIGVANLPTPAARYLVDRISHVAAEMGLRPGQPGCTAEVMIIGAADGAETARAMVQARPRVFRLGLGGMDRGRPALEAFQTGDAPVRWWQVSLPVTAMGDPAIALPGQEPSSTRSQSSRLLTLNRNILASVIIVVDVDQASTVSLSKLADYLAMIALAQIDPEAETGGYDTVLNVFHDPDTPGLTDWDRRYLNALYRVDFTLINPGAQASQLASAMAGYRE